MLPSVPAKNTYKLGTKNINTHEESGSYVCLGTRDRYQLFRDKVELTVPKKLTAFNNMKHSVEMVS